MALRPPPNARRHCEERSDEAISSHQPCAKRRTGDCFASLAMTGIARSSYLGRRLPVRRHVAHLRRHIAFVMLDQNAVGDEEPVGAHPPVADHPRILAEPIRYDAWGIARERSLSVEWG